jgi:hypothetical protein
MLDSTKAEDSQEKTSSNTVATVAAKQWFRDHVVASAALSVTVLTAAGYCVHRSWLFGWYQAAGIPAFSHGWSVQDVVMLGVLNLEVWAFGLFSVTLCAVAIYLLVVLAVHLDERLSVWLARRNSEVDEEGELTSRMRRLRRGLLHIGFCVWLAATMSLVLAVIAFGAWLLSSQPRSLGIEQFKKLQAMVQVGFNEDEAGASREALAHLSERYSYVQAQIGLGGADSPTRCGWLVLQNGEHLLLLTREGPLFVSATGLGFVWKRVAVQTC